MKLFKTIATMLTITLGSILVADAIAGPPPKDDLLPLPVVVENDETNPVPVVVKREELVLIREDYEVPTGKRLLIDDISIHCDLRSDSTYFTAVPTRSSAVLRIVYTPATCPEDLIEDDEVGPFCPSQTYAVGKAESGTIVHLEDGRPVVSAYAGRRIAIFADEGATLSGFCTGTFGQLRGFGISAGSGRLIDFP